MKYINSFTAGFKNRIRQTTEDGRKILEFSVPAKNMDKNLLQKITAQKPGRSFPLLSASESGTDIRLKYYIEPAYISLKNYLYKTRGKQTTANVKRIFQNITTALADLEKYLNPGLEINCCILDAEYIFINEETAEINCLHIPVYDVEKLNNVFQTASFGTCINDCYVEIKFIENDREYLESYLEFLERRDDFTKEDFAGFLGWVYVPFLTEEAAPDWCPDGCGADLNTEACRTRKPKIKPVIKKIIELLRKYAVLILIAVSIPLLVILGVYIYSVLPEPPQPQLTTEAAIIVPPATPEPPPEEPVTVPPTTPEAPPTVPPTTPEPPPEITATVSAISAGDNYTMAVRSDGILWAWGQNSYGQLGNGTLNTITVPAEIMQDVSYVAAGISHTAAIKTDGSLWMWGINADGQLGDGTLGDKFNPVKIMDNVRHVSVGAYHTVAITGDGRLWAWGRNHRGQLGNNSSDSSFIPIFITDDVTHVSAGAHHTAAVKSDGTLWAWGDNSSGQLGNGMRSISTVPVKIMDNAEYVSAGEYSTAAVTADGTLWTWGDNSRGQLGQRSVDNSLTPRRIMLNISSVSMGSDHAAALGRDGTVWTWGYNMHGQLGDGTAESRHGPRKIIDRGMIRISVRNMHTVALRNDGVILRWGSGRLSPEAFIWD
jgi:alpha-tubulin suppressor-like RCC1 family protein